MYKLLFNFLLIGFLSINVNAQEKKDTIGYVKARKSNVYFRNGEMLRIRDVKLLVKSDSVAFSIFKKAKRESVKSLVFGFFGGALFIPGLGLTSQRPSIGLLTLGTSITFIIQSFSIEKKSSKMILEAVKVYNKNSG